MPTRLINLVFYCDPRNGAVDDFRGVARRVERAAPDIRARVCRTDNPAELALGWLCVAARPSVSVEMEGPRWFRPARGKRLRHVSSMGKIRQYRALDAAGAPLPKWTEITPDTRLDPAEWGPYVVVKPAFGRRGAYVWIHRTSRVRFRPPESFGADHPGRRGPMLAQGFVYTGRWPVAYRVLTYFGRPVLALRFRGPPDSPPLEGPDRFRAQGGGRSIVASAKGGKVEFAAEPDLLELATRTHLDTFPQIPTLGVDIMREAGSGRLYLAEVNASGESWLFTNKPGRLIAADFNLDFYRQFDALDAIAETSIELARRLAT